MKKIIGIKIIGMFLNILIAACSDNHSYKYQINGGTEYLKAPPLYRLNSPFGIILPLKNHDYEVPYYSGKGLVGRDLNIWPPETSVTLLDNFGSQHSDNSITVIQ